MEPHPALKEFQVPPAAPHAIVDRLMHAAAGWIGHTLARALDLVVDPTLGAVEFDFDDVPRRLQAKCGGEEGVDLRAHEQRGICQYPGVVPPITRFVVELISTVKSIEP